MARLTANGSCIDPASMLAAPNQHSFGFPSPCWPCVAPCAFRLAFCLALLLFDHPPSSSSMGPGRSSRFALLTFCVVTAHHCQGQGFNFRPVRPNHRAPVPVYRSVLAGYRSEPVEFKFRRSTGSDRYTGRLDRFTGRFGRFTDRFDW